MYYVIIDPCQDYPMHMVLFLARFDLKAIAVFTSPHQYQAYRVFWASMAASAVAEEYLSTQFPSVEALAMQILSETPGEILGIIPWAEMEILFGAELGAALGLDWNPPEVIRLFRNKFAMKEALRASRQVRVNASRVVGSVEEVAAFQQSVGRWPIVVKPAEGAGSRGVFFAEDMNELIGYAIEVFHEGSGDVLLEEYVGGQEYVVNGITDTDGRLLVTDVWRYDKRDVGPHKNIYHQTLKVGSDEPMWMPLSVYATRAIHALGLRKAPVHMELKLDEGGPCLVEVGARFAGGNQPLLASELHGRSLFELAACHYLADGAISWEDVNYDRYDSLQARIVSGVQTRPLEAVSRVIGVEEVNALPSFYGFGKIMPIGSHLPVTTDVLTRSYEVYLVHGDPEQIAADAERVRALLRYE